MAAPTHTSCKTVFQVFAAVNAAAVMPWPIKFEEVPSTSLADTMASAFDDPETADVIFIRNANRIYAHKALLKIRCTNT
jgi:RCC1 and BTB domain-containing protein